MVSDFILLMPESTEMLEKFPQAKQKLDAKQAKSNLRLIKKDIERGNRFTDEDGVERVTVTMRRSRADYLCKAIGDVRRGVDATAAFCVSKPRGQAKKEERDLVIAMAIKEFQDMGMTVEKATQEVSLLTKLEVETIRDCRKKGRKLLSLIEKITPNPNNRDYRCQQSLIDLLHTSYLKKKS